MTAKRLWPLAGASITLDSGLITLGSHGPLTVPIPTFLIEHEQISASTQADVWVLHDPEDWERLGTVEGGHS